MLLRIIVLVLAVLIWAGLYFTGNDSHTADGVVFFGLIVVEAVLIWLQSRKAPAPIR
jgi:hypothetical protein